MEQGVKDEASVDQARMAGLEAGRAWWNSADAEVVNPFSEELLAIAWELGFEDASDEVIGEAMAWKREHRA